MREKAEDTVPLTKEEAFRRVAASSVHAKTPQSWVNHIDVMLRILNMKEPEIKQNDSPNLR